MKIVLKEELLPGGSFDRWATNRPVNWANLDGDAISYVSEAVGRVAGSSLKMTQYGGFLYSNAIPIVNNPGTIYTFNGWYKVENLVTAGGVIEFREYDSTMTDVAGSYLLNANSNIGWTEFSKTVSSVTSGADIELDTATRYVKIRMYLWGTDANLDFYVDDFTFGGARQVTLDRGYTFPTNSSTKLHGKKAESYGGSLFGIKPYNTQVVKGISFIGFKADYERLLYFLGRSEVQYSKYPFWMRDENGVWKLIRYMDNSFNVVTPNQGIYTYGFKFQEEL